MHFPDDKDQSVKNCLVNIQSGPKVGIQYKVNYCIPTVCLLLAHTVCGTLFNVTIRNFSHGVFL